MSHIQETLNAVYCGVELENGKIYQAEDAALQAVTEAVAQLPAESALSTRCAEGDLWLAW